MLSQSTHTMSMACSTYIHQEDQGLFFLTQISLQTSAFIYAWSQFRPIQIGQAFNLKLLLKKENMKKLQQIQDSLASLLFIITHLSSLESYFSCYTFTSSLWTKFRFSFIIYGLRIETRKQERIILFLMAWKNYSYGCT